jgi:hypothetical protein
MKNKLILIFGILIAIAFSCKKETITDNTNLNMSGFGDNEGLVSGTAFVLPDGLEYEGEIMGVEILLSFAKNSISDKNQSQSFSPKKERVVLDTVFGSGGSVEIALCIRNTTNSNIELILPAGLVFHSRSGEYQNGLLIKKATVTIPANSPYRIGLALLCCNLNKELSSPDEVYEKPVVSNNSKVLELCNLVKNKKVHIAEYYDFRTLVGDYTAWRETGRLLQSALWHITREYGNSSLDDAAYSYDFHTETYRQLISALLNSN